MLKNIEELRNKKANLVRILSAVVSLGALFTVNIYGYLSVMPTGMMAVIGPDFIFNYSLQFSMSVAMASLLGWQLGDLTFLVTEMLSRFSKRKIGKSAILEAILRFTSLDFLGGAKHLTLRYSLGLLSFCFLFSGFNTLFLVLFLFEILVIWASASLYLQHRREHENPLPLRSWLNELLDELFETDWRQFELAAFVPLAVFFSLFVANEIGEERANRILQRESIYFAQQDLYATVFATSNAGLILAVSVSDEDIDADSKPKFILVGNSGDEILRSFQD